MIGPRPCAYMYACAYFDPVFTIQSYDIQCKHKNKRNLLVCFSCAYAILTLMSTQFSLAYTCAYAYAYALVKTRFKGFEH